MQTWLLITSVLWFDYFQILSLLRLLYFQLLYQNWVFCIFVLKVLEDFYWICPQSFLIDFKIHFNYLHLLHLLELRLDQILLQKQVDLDFDLDLRVDGYYLKNRLILMEILFFPKYVHLLRIFLLFLHNIYLTYIQFNQISKFAQCFIALTFIEL